MGEKVNFVYLTATTPWTCIGGDTSSQSQENCGAIAFILYCLGIPFAPGGEASLHPSIFIGPHGTRSALHADDSGSRFLMALFKGRKRFRLLNASDVSRCLGTCSLIPPLYRAMGGKSTLCAWSPLCRPGIAATKHTKLIFAPLLKKGRKR